LSASKNTPNERNSSPKELTVHKRKINPVRKGRHPTEKEFEGEDSMERLSKIAPRNKKKKHTK